MTAEVGVMNKLGIALAADSAVTIGRSTNKIYTSADKLFQLAESAHIGIMVYGNSSFLRVPWETIIKVYRKSLGHQNFDTFSEYVDHFIKYLNANRSLFPPESQRSFIKSYLTSFFENLLEQLEKRLDQAPKPLHEQNIEKIFHKLVQEEIHITEKYPKLDQLPKNMHKTLLTEYGDILKPVRENMLGKLPMKPTTERLIDKLILCLLSYRRMGWSTTGVVIAGFGETEYFPTITNIEFRGMALNTLLFGIDDELQIGNEATACIAPFAQKEMVYTFMNGIDPRLEERIENRTTDLFLKASKIIFDELGKTRKVKDSTEKKINESLGKLLTEFHKKLDNFRESAYSLPVMEMVASLPKDELAAMAESLVNLTKFKRRVSDQQETVGGPIDVAVITKGDGFVWVKRKHYFDPALNPRAMSKYYIKNDKEENG